MTSQEEQMLNSLVERVNSTQLSEKDPDAARLLERGFAGNPDSMYILAQSVLVQNIALEQAHAQLAAAQSQLQQQAAPQPSRATSFLGGLLGHRDPAPPPLPPNYQAPQPGYQQVYSPQAAPEYQTPYYPNQPYGGAQYAAAPPGQPSFLRSAAQTAVGVAAGALAFEGVEELLHGGFGHPGMGMGMGGWGMPGVGMGMGYERPIEETVVNNYYDSPGGEEHHSHENVSDAGWDSGSDSSSFDDSGSFGDSGGSGNDDGGF